MKRKTLKLNNFNVCGDSDVTYLLNGMHTIYGLIPASLWCKDQDDFPVDGSVEQAICYWMMVFQSKNGLKVDGIFGEKSWKKFDEKLGEILVAKNREVFGGNFGEKSRELSMVKSRERFMKYFRENHPELLQSSGFNVEFLPINQSILSIDGNLASNFKLPHGLSNRGMYGVQNQAKHKFQKITSPYNLRLTWEADTYTRTIRCHEMVALPLQRVLNAIHYIFTPKDITMYGLDLYGGCYNDRNVTGGSTKSSHAWGAAIDWDTLNNSFRANPKDTHMVRPQNYLFCLIMQMFGFRTLSYDLMHWQFVPKEYR